MGTKSSQLAIHTEPVTRLKILIDARKLGHGGIGTYLENLIVGLQACPEIALAVLTFPGKSQNTSFFREVEVIEDNASLYSFNEFFLLPKRLRNYNFDIFHSPHFTLPYGLKSPSIVTIHDLIHITQPEKFYYPFLAKPIICSALSRASKIITVSQSTKNELLKIGKKIPKLISKIRVIPNALPAIKEMKLDEVNVRFNGNYYLGVFSNLKPHKGFQDLIKAYQMLVRNAGEKIKLPNLVLVGYGTANLTGRFLQDYGPGVKLLGTVTREELFSLYKGALALVVPSLAEGFCLPVIEAQAMGTPVIARPVPSVRELTTVWDLVVKDFEIGSLVQAMEKFVASRPDPVAFELEEFKEKIITRYDCVTLARQVLSVYKEGMEEGKK